MKQRVTALFLLYCCFTAALLTEYRFDLRAGVQRNTVSKYERRIRRYSISLLY